MPLRTTLITVDAADDGRTLQALLRNRAGVSHAEARGLIDAGAVRLAAEGRPGPPAASGPPGAASSKGPAGLPEARRAPGGAVAPGAYALRVRSGQRWEIRRDPGTRYRPRPQPPPGRGFRIVHQDTDLLVVDKRPNLLTVPSELREDEESLIDRLLEAERARGVRRPALYALHRLDRDTSGLLLFARNREAHEKLLAQFADRSIQRVYTAVVAGRLEADRGEFRSRLLEDPRSLKVHSTRRPGKGKEAVTAWEVAERLPGATVVTARLRTGRKNQIRVQFAEAGHPLLGDRRYGEPSRHIARTALHARALRCLHPRTGRPLTLESPLPRDMRVLIKILRRDPDPRAVRSALS